MRWKVGCGGEFDSPTGQITSPNYPQRYGDNLICNYTITATPDTYIIARFIDKFEIEPHPLCIYDRIAAYQGNSSLSAPIGRYCGSQTPTPIVSHNTLFVQFRTDSSITGSGFKISYTKQGLSIFSSHLIKQINQIICSQNVEEQLIHRPLSVHPHIRILITITLIAPGGLKHRLTKWSISSKYCF